VRWGRYGEKLAVEHLLAGVSLCWSAINRTRRGEIDLIAFDGRTLNLRRGQDASAGEIATAGIGQTGWPICPPVSSARYRPVAQAYLDDPRPLPSPQRACASIAIGVLVDAEGAVVDVNAC